MRRPVLGVRVVRTGPPPATTPVGFPPIPAVRAGVAADDRTLVLQQVDEAGRWGVVRVDVGRRDLALAVAVAVNTRRPASPPPAPPRPTPAPRPALREVPDRRLAEAPDEESDEGSHESAPSEDAGRFGLEGPRLAVLDHLADWRLVARLAPDDRLSLSSEVEHGTWSAERDPVVLEPSLTRRLRALLCLPLGQVLPWQEADAAAEGGVEEDLEAGTTVLGGRSGSWRTSARITADGRLSLARESWSGDRGWLLRMRGLTSLASPQREVLRGLLCGGGDEGRATPTASVLLAPTRRGHG